MHLGRIEIATWLREQFCRMAAPWYNVSFWWVLHHANVLYDDNIQYFLMYSMVSYSKPQLIVSMYNVCTMLVMCTFRYTMLSCSCSSVLCSVLQSASTLLWVMWCSCFPYVGLVMFSVDHPDAQPLEKVVWSTWSLTIYTTAGLYKHWQFSIC